LKVCVAGRPPFIGSGGFPYIHVGDHLIRFYPAPETHRTAPDKDFREAVWLSEPLFKAWLNGRTWVDMVAAFEREEIVLLADQGALVTIEEATWLRSSKDLYDETDERYRLWTTGDVTRVAVDRMGGSANVYQVGRLYFARGGGLWCMFAGLDESGFGAQRLETLLSQLGEIGLGGERSSGHGQFDLLPAESVGDLPDPMPGHKLITLSHYHPRYDESSLLGGHASYRIIRRQGWVNSMDNSAQRHKTVRMITAGSVLNKPIGAPQAWYGDLVDVTPNNFNAHKVYRCGQALMLGTFEDDED